MRARTFDVRERENLSSKAGRGEIGLRQSVTQAASGFAIPRSPAKPAVLLGEVQRHGKFWTVRFRLDVPEQDKRIYRRVKVCPVSGPGLLTEPEIQRRAREIVDSCRPNSEERFNQAEGMSLGVTFREQSKWWLEHVQTRNWKPIRASTAEGWKYCLDKWALPAIGDLPLSQVGNPTLKGLVATMKKAGLSAKTIDDYIQPV